jgi:hypothetical protein
MTDTMLRGVPRAMQSCALFINDSAISLSVPPFLHLIENSFGSRTVGKSAFCGSAEPAVTLPMPAAMYERDRASYRAAISSTLAASNRFRSSAR